jgi:hypothetical protein
MRKLFVLGLAMAPLFACQKSPGPEISSESIYTPMEIGKYWIYGHYQIDANGHAIPQFRTDSVIITGDTLINGSKYYVFEGTNYPWNSSQWNSIAMLKDSSGYLVDVNGNIKFAEDNFFEILASKTEIQSGDTLYTLTYKMEVMYRMITVPAGSFEALNYKGTVTMPQDQPGIQNPRYINTLYAKETGKILETYFFLNDARINEKRLLRHGLVGK